MPIPYYRATPTTLPGAEQFRTYGLDGLGNWKKTNYTEVGSGGSTTSIAEVRAHNYVNEITSTKDTPPGGTAGTTPFTYDKNGNLLNDGTRSYQWDALNRLVQINKVSGGAVIGAYAYDALNRRIQKTISNGGLTGDLANTTYNYLYDGPQMAMERTISGGWGQAYFWGPYIDELLFFAVPTITVPTTFRVLSDLLYRCTAIVTTSNVVSEAYDTDAYGNTLCYSGPGTDGLWFTDDDVPTDNPINTTIFTGRQFDPESQIYYYRARYFSPRLGRFISRDPLGSPLMMEDATADSSLRWNALTESLLRALAGAVGTSRRRFDGLYREPLKSAELSQGPNLYWYVQDNPTNAFDPTGTIKFNTWSFSRACDDEESAECVLFCGAMNEIMVGCLIIITYSVEYEGRELIIHTNQRHGCTCLPCDIDSVNGLQT